MEYVSLNAGVYLNELKLNNFEMYECCVNSYKNAVTDDFYQKISIDDLPVVPPIPLIMQ